MASKKTAEPKSKSARSTTKDAFAQYMRDIGRYSLLTRNEEIELAEAIQAGDREALHCLVQANLRFVISFARKYQGLGVSLEDLVQEGNMGLLKAAESFDATRGLRFLTHARHWVKALIFRAIENTGRPVRLPASQHRKIRAVRRAMAELENESGRVPSEEDVAQRAETTIGTVRDVLRTTQSYVHLDAPVDESERPVTFHQSISDDAPPSPVDSLAEAERESCLDSALERLESRRQRILRLYYGLDEDEGATLDSIAQKMGVSRERVRQLRNGALKRLREDDRLAAVAEAETGHTGGRTPSPST